MKDIFSTEDLDFSIKLHAHGFPLNIVKSKVLYIPPHHHHQILQRGENCCNFWLEIYF